MLNRTFCAHVVIALLGAGVLASPADAASGDIYNLGTLPAGSFSGGAGLNVSGQVVGGSYRNGWRAFLYTGTPGSGGTMADLGTLGGESFARAINASGQVTGTSYTGGYPTYPFHAFLYTGTPGSDGVMHDLGTLGGSYSEGNAINDSGQIVGDSWLPGDHELRAFLYTGTPGSGGSMIDLGTVGAANGSQAYAINASGQIAGVSADHTGTPGKGGNMADLGTLGGTYSDGRAVNASGQVTGESWTKQDLTSHAFLYTGIPDSGGAMHDLGTLGGTNSAGYAINTCGQIAGASATTDNVDHAFLYTGTVGIDGRMIDLNDWLQANNPTEGARWILEDATGLTDRGLITGSGSYDLGGGFRGTRAFLLDASALVPEPGSLSLLPISPALLRRRRQR
jgi:probable HAF family extracellular repeat protein